MALNKINILCTRPVPASLVQEALEAGICIDQCSFIKTEPIQNIEVQQEVEQALLQTATVVFTSMNGVEAVANLMDLDPAWSIYCIGNTTHQLVIKYFGEEKVAGTAADATALAELIAEDGSVDEVIFFCGDQRLAELPGILGNAGIMVNEIIVYQTIPLPQKINRDYDGILFFSPSAVHSFFLQNKLAASTILFAIGNTTATAIKKHTSNKIITAAAPGKENLVSDMIAYFKTVQKST